MVDIHVGKDEGSGHFQLHKSILCEKVPYFEKTFNGNFVEGATNSATLPEDDPEAFNILVSNADDLKYWPTEDIDTFLTRHNDLRHEVFKMIRAQREETDFHQQVFNPGCRVHEHGEGQPCSQPYRRANKQREQVL
ncbi:hypothetical protein BCON_0024g00240 [Botryotinia convoluta]|uniref:BTB domain-containing protein n=1 Tax=Botryotinia convoluta TaxID=54673 RepID=A0A4Z1IMM4_9HELO|nr:hypothetical protein BCON_0024g00240 [Botryotinia convoluta]